jgi:hypothetical protein
MSAIRERLDQGQIISVIVKVKNNSAKETLLELNLLLGFKPVYTEKY